MREYESDICIVGSGICGVLAAERLARDHDLSIVVVEAGSRLERNWRAQPGENPLPGDVIPDQIAQGAIMQTMCVGGRATHWGGESPRYAPDDFRMRSLTGKGKDWPIGYSDLEPWYAEAERRIGASSRSVEEGSDLQRFQAWAADAGIETVPTPRAIGSGRPFSPVPALDRLIEAGRVRLLPDTLIRKLELEERSDRVARATGVDRTSAEAVSVSARWFLLAGSYVWTPHLLLLSANARFPDGLANTSGLVGRCITGHPEQGAVFEIDDRLHPHSSLFSSGFVDTPAEGPPTRFGVYLYANFPGARVRADDGRILLGDEILEDLHSQRTRVTFKSYLAVAPSPESRLFLAPSRKNRWGDPLPTINDYANRAATGVARNLPERLEHVLGKLRSRSLGQVGTLQAHLSLHPSGGCRMGDDAATSVCDSFGRCHDHENLVLLGAPTCVTGGCVNSTLTFVALALRSADEVGRAFPRRAPEA